MSDPQRRKTVLADVGGVKVGSQRPIVVQSMTNTDTADVDATVAQMRALHAAGSELVRVTVNTEAAARAVPEIVKQVDVPMIGDFHYNGHVLLTKCPDCARAGEVPDQSEGNMMAILGRAERGRGLRSDWTRAGGGHHLLIP